MLTRDHLDKAREFGHPVLSLLDELVLQNLTLVLRKERDDNALLNSVMLTYLFVATSGNIGQECLTHQSEALCSIRQSMSIPDRATSESTLGAILLLAGIEVCISFQLGKIGQAADDDIGSAWNATKSPTSHGCNRTTS